MSTKRDMGGMMLAPGAASSASSLTFPGREARSKPVAFPPVDEHLVKPEVTRDELIRGRKVVAMPAEGPHADTQVRLDFVVAPHVRPGYIPSADLITRVSEGSNFATDLSIRKEGTDPATGSRYLEELSFEIVNTQSMRDIREKAEDLIARGVRRFVAIFVKTGQICEWSREKGQFVPLDMNGVFEDPLLVRPIALKALLDRTLAGREVVRALDEQGHPEIKRIRQEGLDTGLKKGLDEGLKKGLDEGLLAGQRSMLTRMLRARFGEIPAELAARIQSANEQQLETWADKTGRASSLEDVFIS